MIEYTGLKVAALNLDLYSKNMCYLFTAKLKFKGRSHGKPSSYLNIQFYEPISTFLNLDL